MDADHHALVAVVATPVVSRIADGRLRRQALVAALAVVAAGSLIGAVVPTFAGLLTARALQGLGYAMVPLTVAIAREWLTVSVARPHPGGALDQHRDRRGAAVTR